MSSPKPVCVLIADIHFTPATLELASESLRRARSAAVELGVPLIIAGDTLDSKAIIRAECANSLLEILKETPSPKYTKILVGNHDLINEKGTEHSLNFLNNLPSVEVVSAPYKETGTGLLLIPYQTANSKVWTEWLSRYQEGHTIICHQGVQGAEMGHYIKDSTSLPREAFANFRVISGHYHKAQNIKCGPPRKGAVGLFTYVGNPYSLSFGEANDGPKGIAVLMDDGLLKRIPFSDFRKHVVVEGYVLDERGVILPPGTKEKINAHDLLWLKITGPQSELKKLNKAEIGQSLLGHSNFKLDLIPSDSAPATVETKTLTSEQVLDKLIDNMGETDDQKAYLKVLWREIV